MFQTIIMSTQCDTVNLSIFPCEGSQSQVRLTRCIRKLNEVTEDWERNRPFNFNLVKKFVLKV
jgi:hypothetical protein